MIGKAMARLAEIAGVRKAPGMVSDRLPRAVFLTGAGLSADSGLPTYRGERAETLMTPANLAANPGHVHGFCDDRRSAMRDA